MPGAIDTRYQVRPEEMSGGQVTPAYQERVSRYYTPTTTPPANTTGGSPTSRYTNAAEGLFSSGGAMSFNMPDENAVRERARAGVQSQIDAINELAESELASARRAGEERLGETRAVSAATGLLGSGRGLAHKEKVRDLNLQEEKVIRAQAQEKIGALLANVEARSEDILEKERTLARSNATAYLEYLSGVSERALSDMQALATAGADLSDDQRNRLVEQTGYDPETFDSLYKSMRISNDDSYINKDKPQIVGNNAVFFKQVKDPKTGAVSIVSETLALPESEKEIKSTVSRDDGIYVLYTDGSYQKVGEPSAAMIKAQKGEEADQVDPTTISNQIATAKNALAKAKELAGAAGRGRTWLEAKKQAFFGDTEYTNLEAYANTLRTNILSLATDPQVKKFFGPQMSNADVQLMTSAGTSLNPELMGPASFKNELTRLEDLLNRLETAKGVGQGGGVTVSTPDGQTFMFESQEDADAFRKEAGL